VAIHPCVLKWNLETARQNKNLDKLAVWKLRYERDREVEVARSAGKQESIGQELRCLCHSI